MKSRRSLRHKRRRTEDVDEVPGERVAISRAGSSAASLARKLHFEDAEREHDVRAVPEESLTECRRLDNALLQQFLEDEYNGPVAVSKVANMPCSTLVTIPVLSAGSKYGGPMCIGD